MAPEWIRQRELHGSVFRKELENWLLISQGQPETIVKECLLMLEEDYLLSLPLPPGVMLPLVPGPRNFRFLFRREIASLLYWKERRAEGDSQGFSDKLNSLIREVWWPDELSETLHGDSLRERTSCVTSPTVREGQSIGPVERSNITRGENFEVEHPSQVLSSSPGHHRRQHQNASTEPEQSKIQETGQRFQGGKRGVTDRRSKTNRRGAIDIPDSSAVHQPSDAAYDQRLVLRGCDFPEGIGRSVRQRLELGEGGTLVLEQSVVGLPSSSLREMVPVGQRNSSQARETAIRELQAPKKKTIKRGSGVINQNTASLYRNRVKWEEKWMSY